MKQGMCQQQKHPVCYCSTSICTGNGFSLICIQEYLSILPPPLLRDIKQQKPIKTQDIRSNNIAVCTQMVGELSYSVFFCGSPTILQNVQKHGWLIVIFCLFLWSPHNSAVCTKTWLGNCHILCLFSVVPPLVRPSTHPCQKSEPMQI